MGSPRVVRWCIYVALVDLVWVIHTDKGREALGLIAFELLLLWGLDRGWFLCWLVLLAQYVLALSIGLRIFGFGAQGVHLGDAAAGVFPALVLVALLLTREIRVWVGVGYPADSA